MNLEQIPQRFDEKFIEPKHPDFKKSGWMNEYTDIKHHLLKELHSYITGKVEGLRERRFERFNEAVMKNIKIGNIEMPLNAATKTFAVLAKRGAGKTYTAAVMAEEFHKAGIPFVVFDPIDVWWGLRFAADGKSEGLPVVVFGVHNADIKLERDMGAQIAQAIVKHNISCVISTYGLPKVAQRQLIQEFSEELLNINDRARHVFIEEAHEFVPQRVFGAMGKVFAAVEALVVMGRNKGPPRRRLRRRH